MWRLTVSLKPMGWALLLLVTCATQMARADTEVRSALVIGNSAYKSSPLRNASNDASALAETLKSLGFETTLRNNTSRAEMLDALRDFTKQASRSQVRLLFYAGHGLQIKGRNYLLPIDVELQSEDEAPMRAIDLTELLDRLSAERGGINIVVLDACRDNPFGPNLAKLADARRPRTRGLGESTQGLAAVQAPSGTLVAFSTSPGSVAMDGAGQQHSIYAKHLLANLGRPGIPIERVFKQVRIGVALETQRQQVPWETSSLMGDFCFRAGANGKCTP